MDMPKTVRVLPAYLAESSIVTQDETFLTQHWVEAVTPRSEGKSAGEDWLDGWLSTALPFSFRYGNQESSTLLARWHLQKRKRNKNSDKQDFVWTDTKTGLRLTWQMKTFRDYPAVEWVLWFENMGKSDTALIENVQALDLRLKHSQLDKQFVIHGANGGRSLPDDFLPFSRQLPSIDASRQKEIQLGGDHPSSNRHLPFFNLETLEDRGVLVGVGWSGCWLAKVRVEDAKLRALTGLKETSFSLRPGEKIRTPKILLVFWKGERLHGHNMLRQVLYKYYVPRLQGKPQKPFVSVNVCFTYHGLGGFLQQATEKDVLALIEPFKEIGAELLIIDAGWYRTDSGTWWDGMGDWKYDPKKYPRGFRPISKPLAAANIPFGLWFASELLGKNVPLWREHPEWCRPVNPWSSGGSLRMEVPEAREWFLEQVEYLIRNEGMSCYRQDGAGSHDPEPDYRKGISEMMHIAGLYALWDTLIERHPDLVMEGCSGGGRRIDLETLSRFHWHQKADRWYDSESDHCGLYGANLYLPGGVINIPTEATDDYGTWSSFAGQFCLGWHPLDKDFPMKLARRQVERYKRIRHLLSGDFYPLTPCSLEEPWVGYQFHRNDLDEGFALLFRRSVSSKAVYPLSDAFKLRLRGLNPQNRYNVHFERGNRDEMLTSDTLSKGIDITINEVPGVEMVIYKSSR